ncbi:Hypp8163 [Branchiostoma lanceolatum]|uniref:Hypp8163 protein n=1 Tax=Branchiostoma lanceolatum TaxID=7740 RepID=A0A8K0EGY9_BRALA|nr:Hypp8163 [Branchiostoma lanceolatum]
MAAALKSSLILFLALGLLATPEAGFPRLHFSGLFLADTSTLNNDPHNFNIDNFDINRNPPCYPNYTFPHCNWNPRGGGDFRLFNCSVTKVCYKSGKCTTNDPIVGRGITGSNDTVAAKMVDLDPYFQMYTSQLWGLVVGVEGAFQGTFKVNTVMDIWQRCKEEKCLGDPGSSGYWSSVLESVTWLNKGDPKSTQSKKVPTFIDQLKYPHGEADTAKSLYIKFTVDMMNEDPRTPNFAHGRVIGSISSVDNKESLELGFPEFNRMLWGQGIISALVGHQVLPEMKDYYHAPFYMDDVNNKVVVDLSNSLPTHLNGTLVDRGNLFLLLIYSKSLLHINDGIIRNCGDILNDPSINVGAIGYTTDDWLLQDAGIVILDMDMAMEERPVVMVVKEEAPPCQSCQKQCLPVLVEHPKGLYIGAAEDRVFRIPKPITKKESSVEEDDETGKVSWSLKIFATAFGKVATGVELSVSLRMDPNRKAICKPENAINVVSDSPNQQKTNGKYTTDGQGLAVIKFQTDREGLDCSDPGVDIRREQQIEGQLYVYRIILPPEHDIAFPPDLQTYTHLYCKHEGKETYTWVDDIYQKFQRYDNLFPVMKPLFSLASYKQVIRSSTKKQLLHSLVLPIEDPNHMPVTRDLSLAKRNMVVNWLKSADLKYSRINPEIELTELLENLNLALRLEWATIPPYLSAYYSIKDGFNTKVGTLIKSIVVEEMNHLSLVANIINAIGGTPVLNNTDLIPTYPAPLPGGCHQSITIQLAKCSLHQIHDIFMVIEMPECSGKIIENINALEILDGDMSYTTEFDASDFASTDPVRSKCSDLEPETLEALLEEVTTKCKEMVENYQPDTIGAIYIHKILCPMIDLYKRGILRFGEDPSKQYPRPFPVTDLCTAIMAIHLIVDQGEGGNPCDPFYKGINGERELSHYYKFAEIVHGKTLVEAQPDHYGYQQNEGEQEYGVCSKPEEDFFTPCKGQFCCPKKYKFAGAPIPFFENAVWPILPNPKSSKYPPGSRARKMSDRWNEKYTTLMKCLHDMYNGNPGNMKKCFGIMSSLTVDAKRMVQTPIDPYGDPNIGPNVAPTFEWYPPVN